MQANSVNISSGQLLFGDPTKPWSPNNFPALPSTNLILTVSGRVEDQTFSSLTFKNSISYEPYEQSTIRSSLEKILVTDAKGLVCYVTPHVGFVSSFNAAYQQPISSFTASTIGGANIQTPNDTITNGLAKLDSWITNTFLLQPPCVTPTEYISSSLYGSVRWKNFVTYNILNTFAPYVSALTFIIGDPSTPNYLTLEWTGCDYFPFRNYTDGISPARTPLVKIRIFTDFFPNFVNKVYTKQTMQTNGMTIISESGTCALPASGKVFAIEDTDHSSSYTTFNFYLPNLAQAYPKDTPIPVNIAYMNNTLPEPNVCNMSMTIASQGAPSQPSLSISETTTNCLTYVITPPTYSDAIQQITNNYNSTYSINYRWNKFQTVYNANSGFIYGTPSQSVLPDFLSTYQSTYSYKIPYFNSTLTTHQMGLEQTPFIPASQFETAVSATNNARLQGTFTPLVYASTTFTTTRTSTLHNVYLRPNGPGLFNSNSVYSMYYGTNGWQVSTTLSTNVFFLSSPTNVPLITSIPVQLNAATYPGDRNPISFTTRHTDINNNQRSLGYQISISSGTNDYTLQQPYGYQNDGDDIMYATLLETNPELGFSHYYYNVRLEGQPLISSISETLQKVQLAIRNTALNNNTESTQTVSSAIYEFKTEGFGTFTIDDAGYNSTASQVVYVSGIPTAADTAELYYNIKSKNQLRNYGPSTLGYASLRIDDISVGPDDSLISSILVQGPATQYISSIKLFNTTGSTPIITTPWPANYSMQYSSLAVVLNNNISQDPVCPHPIFIEATLLNQFPYNPQTVDVSLTSSFYIDTISAYSNQKFQSPTLQYGLHVQSFLPRSGFTANSNDMGDGVDCHGLTSNGLNVSYSSFITLTSTSIILQSTILYDNTSNLTPLYTSTYSREVMMLQGKWLHPSELDFTPFDASLYGLSTIFPCFNYDLYYDTNNGFRYATFLFNQPLSTQTVFNSIDITFNNVNFIGTLTTDTQTNTFFPDAPIDQAYVQNSLVKLHVKHFATYEDCGSETVETAWINGFKKDVPQFTDAAFDEGGCFNVSTTVSTMVSSITYSVLLSPRFYTNIATLVRVGLSRFRDEETGENISFENLTIQYKS
jgi:hypothetical protein